MAEARKTIIIDRKASIDFEGFLGMDDLGFVIDKQDECSLSLREVDPAEIRLVSLYHNDEKRAILIPDVVDRRCRDAGYIALDARFFYALWQDQSLIPNDWKREKTRIYFEGTVFGLDVVPAAFILYLYMDGGEWKKGLDFGGELEEDEVFLWAVLPDRPLEELDWTDHKKEVWEELPYKDGD